MEFLQFVAFETSFAFTLGDIGFSLGSLTQEEAMAEDAERMAHYMMYHDELVVREGSDTIPDYVITIMGDGEVPNHYRRINAA